MAELQPPEQEWQGAHAPQLSSQNVPQHLWPALQAKLTGQVFDAGEHLMMDWDADGTGWHVLVANPEGLRAEDPNTIFLVDHAWRCATRSAFFGGAPFVGGAFLASDTGDV